MAPREEDAAGPHDTIAGYIEENGIQETPVKRGDPGSPTIDLPFPDGWEDAGADTPEWAYSAIVYTGPEAAEYPPSIVALVSRLDGDVDPQTILDVAGGELQNLPGYEGWNEGTFSALGEFPAFQLGGTWVQDGLTKIVAPEDGRDRGRRRALRTATQRGWDRGPGRYRQRGNRCHRRRDRDHA